MPAISAAGSVIGQSEPNTTRSAPCRAISARSRALSSSPSVGGQDVSRIAREPTTMFRVVYNNAYQFVQTPGYVLIVAEMIHDARIIPMGKSGAQHIDSRVRSWGGDSRGHWEGSTLVVETTNFHGRGWLTTGLNAVPVRGVPTSEQMRIVERFTRVNHDTMQYEIAIDDPVSYTAPWKIAYPLARDAEYQMFEYACHEGNHAIELILRGAPVQEQAAKN